MAPRFKPVPAEAVVTSAFGPRWGTVHRGVDYGRAGGSANMPVYAAQGGTVVYAGAASGFGGPAPAGWVVIDHPAADGAGTTVYGHIIGEVSVGQRVEAGQRIGRVNPNSSTNGGVAPHLHFEVHPYVWQQGSQIDPLPWLAGAATPGQTGNQTAPAPAGVLFGVDVSEFQNGMALTRAKAEGMAYAIIRTTDGTYKDRVYRSHYDDAKNSGLEIMAYHYLRNPSEGTNVAQQVQASLEVMGDRRAPMWLDCETPAGLHVNHISEAKRAFEQAGVRVLGIYSYVPFWENQVAPAEPDTHALGAVWVAAYGSNPHGAPASIYPGNKHRQWAYPLGNQTPMFWQFGSNGQVADFSVDVNAYRGSLASLQAFIRGAASTEDKPKLPSKPTPAPEHTEPVAPNPYRQPPPAPAVTEDKPEPPSQPTPSVTRRSVMDLILDTLVSAIVGKRPQ